MSDDSMRVTINRQGAVAAWGTKPVSSLKGTIAKIGAGFRAFHEDVRGIAAVEFGLIAPVMLAFLIGTIEVTRAVAIDHRFSQVTSMVADLVTRSTELTADDVNAIYAVTGEVMRPYDVSDLTISIIPIVSGRDNPEDTRVYAGTANRPSFNGGALPAKCQSYTLTEGMLGPTEAVIVVEATYTFKPLFVGSLLGQKDWTSKAFAKPRIGLFVKFDGNDLSSCFS
jgi:Flp pilus assembly protein TadG